jgi:hypothetical protein
LALPTKKLFLGLIYAKFFSMIKKLACFLLFSAAVVAGFSQTTTSSTKKTGRPDIPGTFVLEYGFTRDIGGPSNYSLFLWGSRTVNVYYQYDLRLFKSKFSIVPGIGLSLERYSFKNFRTFHFNEKRDSLFLLRTGETDKVIFDTLFVKKSRLVTNYIDLPIEFRYTSKPDDPARAFKLGVGARVGYLFDSFTKLKYHQDGENKTLKDKQNYFLTQFRYGVFAKVGFGNFALFGYYNLNNLFQDNKSPYGWDRGNTTATPARPAKFYTTNFPTMTVGISLSSF